MNKLTLFWNHRQSDHFYWCVSAHKTGVQLPPANLEPLAQLESHEILKADLACLADLAQDHRVELVIDSCDVYSGAVNLPHKAQRHLRKAVPYLLEESLAESVDHLFIAVGQRRTDGQIPVRAISLEYLKQIIEQFALAEIKLDRILVDLDLLDVPEEGYRLTLINDRVLVAEQNGERWACDQLDFTWLVQKRLAESADEEELPIAIPMRVTCADEEAYQVFVQQLPVGRFAPLIDLVETVEETLAESSQPPLNLLQGEFEPKSERSPVVVLLKKVATIAAFVLTAHILYQVTQITTLNAQKTLLGDERSALWQQAFPGRAEPSNPDKALRSFLTSVRGGQGESGFLPLLESTSGLITDMSQLYPTNISYSVARNELRMDLIAKDLPVLNNFRDELKKNGHEVDMSSATQRGDGYSSRLIIRR
jgi:general secretion pathway protein L